MKMITGYTEIWDNGLWPLTPKKFSLCKVTTEQQQQYRWKEKCVFLRLEIKPKALQVTELHGPAAVQLPEGQEATGKTWES